MVGVTAGAVGVVGPRHVDRAVDEGEPRVVPVVDADAELRRIRHAVAHLDVVRPVLAAVRTERREVLHFVVRRCVLVVARVVPGDGDVA